MNNTYNNKTKNKEEPNIDIRYLVSERQLAARLLSLKKNVIIFKKIQNRQLLLPWFPV